MAIDTLLNNLLTTYLNDLGSSNKNKNLRIPRTETSASDSTPEPSSKELRSAIANIKSALDPLEEDIFESALSEIENANEDRQLVKDFNRDKQQRQASNMFFNGFMDRLKSLASINDAQGQKLPLFLTA
jgi:hypothetical protein